MVMDNVVFYYREAILYFKTKMVTGNGRILHLCTFKTPTSWAVMSERGDTDCAFKMRNGVNVHRFKN